MILTAALRLAEQGFEVYLVEKEDRLGGNLLNLHTTLEGGDVQAFLRDLIDKVSGHPAIHLLLNSTVVDFSGVRGNFTTGVRTAPAMAKNNPRPYGSTELAMGRLRMSDFIDRKRDGAAGNEWHRRRRHAGESVTTGGSGEAAAQQRCAVSPGRV